MNFYECFDLTKKVYLVFVPFVQIIMPNFEAFHEVILSCINVVFLKNAAALDFFYKSRRRRKVKTKVRISHDGFCKNSYN